MFPLATVGRNRHVGHSLNQHHAVESRVVLLPRDMQPVANHRRANRDGFPTDTLNYVLPSTYAHLLYNPSTKLITRAWLAFRLLYIICIKQATTHSNQQREITTMRNILTQLANDENGFIVSAELILVATIVVLSMVVGLSEVSANINQELEDVGSAFGAINQSYNYRLSRGHKGRSNGSNFSDSFDECDDDCDISCNGGSVNEWGF